MTDPNSSYLTAYRSIDETLKAPPVGCALLVVQESTRVAQIVRAARSHGIAVERVHKAELRRLAGESARDCALRVPRGHSGSAAILADIIAPAGVTSALIVILDHVTDPHNFGAILRSADQFHVDGVVIPDRRSADITPVVLQASAGSATKVPLVRVKNLVSAIETLKSASYWVYGADMTGVRADATDLAGRIALVMGAEGPGLSRLIRDRSDALVRVPAKGHADSFNVSVATGILLYEIRRQQNWFEGC